MELDWKSIGVHATVFLEIKKMTHCVISEETSGFWNNSDNSFAFPIFKYFLSLINGGRKLTCGEIWQTTIAILAKREQISFQSSNTWTKTS